MCCRDTEAETPPKKPASATPVWRTVRSGASEQHMPERLIVVATSNFCQHAR
jgi:hypothetical protein